MAAVTYAEAKATLDAMSHLANEDGYVLASSKVIAQQIGIPDMPINILLPRIQALEFVGCVKTYDFAKLSTRGDKGTFSQRIFKVVNSELDEAAFDTSPEGRIKALEAEVEGLRRQLAEVRGDKPTKSGE